MRTLQLGEEFGGSPRCKCPPADNQLPHPHPLFCYISLLVTLIKNTFLLTTHSNFSVLNFKRKEPLGTRLMSTKTMVRRYVIGNTLMRSKAFYASEVGLGYLENQSLVCRKKLTSNCDLGCVRGIMHFLIQSALLDYSFPFLFLVCYIRLLYRT